MNKKKLIIFLVALAVVVLVLIAVILMRTYKNRNVSERAEIATKNNEITGNEAVDKSVATDELVIATETPQYTVTFYDVNGIIVDQQIVKEGESAVPVNGPYANIIADELTLQSDDEASAKAEPDYPKSDLTKEGEQFAGWDEPLDNITHDVDVHPIVEDISEKENVIFGDAVYVKQGDDVAYTIELGSQTEIAALELIIHYDSDELSYRGCQNLDSGVQTNALSSSNEIRISYLSAENTEGALYLGDFVFNAVGEKNTASTLDITVNLAEKINDNGDIVDAQCEVSEGTIYIY